jgi:iron complex transport system ATP-binding protein
MALPVAPAEPDVVFRASCVDLVRDGQLLLDQVSTTIRAGEHWALLGPNGAGKSTLLQIMASYEYPTRGQVDILGHRLGRVNVFSLRPRIGHVSPHHRVDPQRTVGEVVLTGATGTVQLVQRRATSQDEIVRAAALTELMGLADRAGARWHVLSQGERSRALIARALMAQPALLLLDEPAAGLGLDEIAMLEALVRATADAGVAVLLVEHDVAFVGRIADRVVALERGRVIAEGPPDHVRAHPDVLRSYFGDVDLVAPSDRDAATQAVPVEVDRE